MRSSLNFVGAVVGLCSNSVLQDATASQSSGLRFDAVFGDGMLLQRSQPVSIWGSGAIPGADVNVVLTVPGTPGATASTVAGPAGNWTVSLPGVPGACFDHAVGQMQRASKLRHVQRKDIGLVFADRCVVLLSDGGVLFWVHVDTGGLGFQGA